MWPMFSIHFPERPPLKQGNTAKAKPSSDVKHYIIIRALLCYQQLGASMGSLRRPKLK